MLYMCEKCKYLFMGDKQLTELQNDRYRCPDCGKFGVREANGSEQEEYRLQLQTADAWLDADPFEERRKKCSDDLKKPDYKNE